MTLNLGRNLFYQSTHKYIDFFLITIWNCRAVRERGKTERDCVCVTAGGQGGGAARVGNGGGKGNCMARFPGDFQKRLQIYSYHQTLCPLSSKNMGSDGDLDHRGYLLA